MYTHAFKLWTRVFAVILMIGLTFTNFNGSGGFLSSKAYAVPTDQISEEDASIQGDTPAAPPEPEKSDQLKEASDPVNVVSDEYTNVYQNPDGTKTIDFFANPVNFYDENGKLQRIESEIVNADTEKQEEGVKYETKAGMVSVELPEDVVSENPIRIGYDKYTVEMYPVAEVRYVTKAETSGETDTTASPQAQVTETPSTTQPKATDTVAPAEAPTETVTQIPAQTETVPDEYKAEEVKKTFDENGEIIEFASQQEKQDAIEKGDAIEKTHSVKYQSGYDEKIDIEYTPTNTGLKEDIILNEYTGQNAFEFMLNVGKLVPEITETMEIKFTDPETKEVVGMIPSPYMHDSFEGEILEETGDHISQAVTYTIKETGNEGEYVLTVTADKAFLEDKDTVYPVTIDPTFTYVYDTSSEVGDAFVTSKYPNNNYNTDTYLRVGLSGDYDTSRGYIRIPSTCDLRDFVLGRTVTSATLRVYEDSGYTSDATYNIHQITANYNVGELNWYNKPSYTSTVHASKNINGAGYYTFDITNMVQSWVDNTSLVTGMLLKYSDDLSGVGRYRRFRSTCYGDSSGLRMTVTCEDQAAPTQPTSLYTTQSFSGSTGSITLRWSGIADQPQTAGASGIDYYRLAYRRNNGSWVYVNQTNASATSYVFTDLLDNSEYDFAIKTYDKNGNASAYSYVHDILTPDKTGPTAPTVSTTPVATTDWTNDLSPTINWSGITDEGNHLSSVKYTVVNSSIDWTKMGATASGSYNADFSSLSSGHRSIKVCAWDSAGNQGTETTILYLLDRGAPAAPTSVTGPAGWIKTNPSISWSGITDTISGVKKAQYKIDSGSYKDIPTSYGTASGTYTVSMSGLSSGTHTITIRGVDNAGNVGSSRSATVYYDITGPTAPTNVILEMIDWETGLAYIGASGSTDAQSGVDRYQYSTTGSASGFANIPANGQITTSAQTVYFRAVDKVGNYGTAKAASFGVAPVTNLAARGAYNYSTILRWTASSTPEARYNIYRTAQGQSTPVLVASNIEQLYWVDYDLNYGTQYVYAVKATKIIDGTPTESDAADTAPVTVVDSISEQIGKKSYEQPVGFSTGSGSGFINPSGNVLYIAGDLSGQSPTGNLGFSRSYNSQATYSTALGEGWDFNYNIVLLKEYNVSGEETAVILKTGEGTVYRFTKNQNGTYSRPNGLHAELIYNFALNKYFIKFKGNMVYAFNANNRIESITDRKGNRLQFTYNGLGQLVTVTDNVQNELVITYYGDGDSAGLIQTVTCSNRTYNYVYTDGMLAEACITVDEEPNGERYAYPNGMLTTVTNPGGYDYALTYDANGKVTDILNPLGQNEDISYGTEGEDILVTTVLNYETQKYYYNAASRLLHKYEDVYSDNATTVYAYDADYNVTTVTYPNNTTNSYSYDNSGNVLTSTNAAGKTTLYTYDTGDNSDLPVQVSEPFNGADRKITHNVYDAHGNLTAAYIEGINQASAYTYDALGNVTSQTVTVTGSGGTSVSTTEYAYDAKGRLVETTNPDNTTAQQAYDGYGNVDTATDAKDVATRYEYDILGRQESVTSAYGTADAVTTSTTYYAMGDVRTETDGKGEVTEVTYDALGREASVTKPDGTVETTVYYALADGTQGQLTTDAEGNRHISGKKGLISYTGVLGAVGGNNESTYDAALPDGYTLPANIRYDDTNKCYVITTEMGEYSVLSYNVTQNDVMGNAVWTVDEADAVTTNEYDSLGRVTGTTTAKGTDSETMGYTYDDAGNVLQAVAPDITTVSAYDKLGRPLTVTKTKNGTSNTTYYSYDGVHNGKTQNTMTDPLGRVSVTVFDTAGKIDHETQGNKTTSYTYDANGNMLTSTLTDTAYAGQSAATTYTYNTLGQKTKVAYSTDYFAEYAYDDNGNVTQEKLTAPEKITVTNCTYDENNRVTKKTRQAGGGAETVIAQYTYTDTGNLESIQYGDAGGTRIGYTYDEAGKVITVRDWTNGGDLALAPVLREYFYEDGLLKRLEDVRGNGRAKQEFAYDDLNKLKTVKYYSQDNSTVLEEYTLTYGEGKDSNRITQETITTRYGGNEVTVVKDYTYDNLGRLTQDTIGGVATQYTYDAVGNRLTMTKDGVTYTYHYDYEDHPNGSDQLTSVTDGSSTIAAYGYDLSGNETSKVVGNITTTYTYDAANYLKSVTAQEGQNPAAVIASYEYDAAGQRTKKTVGSDETNYYYNGIDLLYTKDGSGGTIEENVLEDDGSIVSSKRANGNSYWYRQDVRGSITNIVDSADAVVKSYTYEAYGKTTAAGAFVNSFAYTGAVIDDETGLYYMNARYYEPETGRFISQDSYRGDGEAFWHLYLYCDGDPVNSIDPTGHFFWFVVAAVVWSVGVSVAADALDDGKVNMPWYHHASAALWGFADGLTMGRTSAARTAIGTIAKETVIKQGTKKAVKQAVVKQGTRKATRTAIKGTRKNVFKTQDLLDSHYAKHANEFGNITKHQYLKGAQNLVNSKPGGNILTKTRSNGDVLFYNKANNQFAVKTSNGTIRTYFKPTDGIDYFNRQK